MMARVPYFAALGVSVFMFCGSGQLRASDLVAAEQGDVEVVDRLALCASEKAAQVTMALERVRELRQNAVDVAKEFYANTTNHDLLLKHYQANAAYSCAEEVFRALEALPIERFVPGSGMYQQLYQSLWEAKYSKSR